jgi:hypothetical protein
VVDFQRLRYFENEKGRFLGPDRKHVPKWRKGGTTYLNT